MATYLPIKRFTKYRVGDDGSVWSNHSGTWKRLVATPNKDGYPGVSLFGNGKRWDVLVHTLVLTAFVGPRPADHHACHFPDGDPKNNNLTNLRWDTPKGNQVDSKFHGTRVDNRGEKSGNAKLTVKKVLEIRIRLAAGDMQKEIASDFGIDQTTVSNIATRKRWKHI
jgi:predicted XRE-type DNA-binding protein